MQHNPKVNNNPHIADLVCEDIQKRKEQGIETYGMALQAFNSRNSLQDAYEEVLDLAQYMKQMQEERREIVQVLEQYADQYENWWLADDLLRRMGERK